MARISLRAYNREIESLIDRGHYEQAFAHCRHILKYYTKHINTYRLLGKAFLESQRYGDAADIFQRVLSSIPDDFVSHVGMSIIREDEGNLDEALWHIERAYEVQPGNKAIQGELRRLYGRRDGMEPPKIQLTRGALARMYLRGELYQQAISELRPAISQSQQRPDLLVVLARAYYLSEQRVPAADTCSSLLKKYPYCLEANRILADILSDSERAEEANVYLKRAIALDPYLSQLSSQAPTADQVPEAAIVLEKLDWTPDAAIAVGASQPEWASSLGVEVDGLEEKDDSMPDWLSSPSQEDGSSPDTGPSVIGEVPQPEEGVESAEPGEAPFLPEDDATQEEIPGWMKDAGWVPATGELDESTLLPDLDDDETASNELAPAEMPDWLQEMAPELDSMEDTPRPEGEPTEEDVILPTESDVLPWLDEQPPGSTDTVVTFLEDKDSALPGTSEIDLDADESVEVPDWLQDFQEEPPLETNLEPTVAPADTPPGADSEITIEQEIPAAAEEFSADDIQPAEAAEQVPPDEGVPAWLTGLAAEQVGEAIIESIPGGTEPEEESSEGEEADRPVEPEEKLTEEQIPEVGSPTAIATEDDSDWLREFEAAAEDDVQVTDQAPGGEDLATEIFAAEDTSADLPTAFEAIEGETTEDAPALEITDEPLAEVTVPEAVSEPDSIDDDEAFAWLESLAEKQGATEAMLLSPEDRQEEPPEWVQQASTEPASGTPEGVGDEVPEPGGEALPEWLSTETPLEEKESEALKMSDQPSEELPDWLASKVEDAPFIASEGEFEQEPDIGIEVEGEPEIKPEGEIPSWIKAGAVATGATAIGAAMASADGEATDEQETPADEFAIEAELEAPIDDAGEVGDPEEVEAGIPDWLQEVTEAAPTTESELVPNAETELDAEGEPEIEPVDEMPSWMQASAVAAGAAAVGAAVSSADDEQDEPADEFTAEAELEVLGDVDDEVGIPDWLQEVTEAAPISDSEFVPAAEIELDSEDEDQIGAQPAEVPEWIKEISPEPVETLSEIETQASETEGVLAIPDQPVTSPISEMLFAPLVQTIEEPELAVEEVESVEEEVESEEFVEETLVVDEGPIIEGDTAPTQVTPPDQIPVPPVVPLVLSEEALSAEVDFDDETPAFEVPDWLQDIEGEIPTPDIADTEIAVEVEDVSSKEVESAVEGIPDWLSDTDVDTSEETLALADLEEPAIEESTLEDQPEPEAETPAEAAVLEDDDAFAWLESLAAKQGAEEALLLSPEDRKEEPPEWVEQAVAEGEAAVSDETQPGLEEVVDESEPEETFAVTEEQAVTALDISDEETIPLEELGLDVPDLEAILGEQIGDEGVVQETDLPVTPPSLDEVTTEEFPTKVDGYAQTQPLPDLSEILSEEPISHIEEVTEESVEAPVDADAEVLEEDLPDLVESEEILAVVPELASSPETPESIIGDETTTESVPELPDWLADVEEEVTAEGEDEWTPSEELLAQTGALDDVPDAEPEVTPLDVNMAGLVDFERLPGVGFIKAQAIIQHREVHGPYTNIDDLEDVPDLDKAMVDEIREFITVEGPTESIIEGPSDDNQVTLIQARNLLIKGDIEFAIQHYQSLINAEQLLPEVIQDLNDALYRHPMDVSIWQTLGDAHVRLGQFQEALDSYTKAEELLR